MGVLDVLRGAAKVGGAGLEGYGVDQQIKVRDAMAQRKAEQEAERDRVLNLLTQTQTKAAGERLPTPPQRVYDPERGVIVDELAGSFAPLEGLPPLTPKPSQTDIHATNRRFDIDNPLPERGGGAEQSWQTIQTPDGLIQVDPKGSGTRPVTGADGQQVQGTGSRPSETERRSAALLQQIDNASEIVRNYQPKINANLARIPVAGNYALKHDPETQVALQAAEQLASSYLYLVSGAAVTEQEAKRTMRLFVPQPGDGPDVLARKRNALDSMLQAARTAAGRAAPPRTGATPGSTPATPSRPGVPSFDEWRSSRGNK